MGGEEEAAVLDVLSPFFHLFVLSYQWVVPVWVASVCFISCRSFFGGGVLYIYARQARMAVSGLFLLLGF